MQYDLPRPPTRSRWKCCPGMRHHCRDVRLVFGYDLVKLRCTNAITRARLCMVCVGVCCVSVMCFAYIDGPPHTQSRIQHHAIVLCSVVCRSICHFSAPKVAPSMHYKYSHNSVRITRTKTRTHTCTHSVGYQNSRLS